MGVIGRAGGGTEQAALVLRKFGHLYVSPARHVVLTVTRQHVTLSLTVSRDS
jgi:hypothetical protein